MDFKPGEFFIGLVEFITILLPGAVGAFIILLFEQNHTIEPNHTLFQYAFEQEKEIISWVVFVFSYKWATVILEANYPAICEQITCMMAASKFFRSMVLAAAAFFGTRSYRSNSDPFMAGQRRDSDLLHS